MYVQGFAESLQQVGEVTSKYGSQSSKGLPTTVNLSTAPSHRMADKGALQQHIQCSLPVARILQNSVCMYVCVYVCILTWYICSTARVWFELTSNSLNLLVMGRAIV